MAVRPEGFFDCILAQRPSENSGRLYWNFWCRIRRILTLGCRKIPIMGGIE